MWHVMQEFNGRWERCYTVATRREARSLAKYTSEVYKCRARVVRGV